MLVKKKKRREKLLTALKEIRWYTQREGEKKRGGGKKSQFSLFTKLISRDFLFFPLRAHVYVRISVYIEGERGERREGEPMCGKPQERKRRRPKTKLSESSKFTARHIGCETESERN